MKTQEYELNINTIYLRTDGAKEGEKEPVEGKCNNYNVRKNEGHPIWIMEHHTVSDTEKSFGYFLKGAVSPHYMIDLDGTIYHLVADGNRAYHAGVGNLPFGSKMNPYLKEDILKNDMNSWAIGIENVNNAITPFTPEQIKANIYLHEKLVNDLGINPKDIIGHADWTPGRKIDPSPYYDWEALANASEKYEDIEHNFGIYPVIELKYDPEIIVSYKKNDNKEDVAHLQQQLQELGYNVLEPEDANFGIYDQKTRDAAFTFSIRFMNKSIIEDAVKIGFWDDACNDALDQKIPRGELAAWSENHDQVMGDVLELYSA